MKPRPLKPKSFFKPHPSLLLTLLTLLTSAQTQTTTFPYEKVPLGNYTVAGGAFASLLFPLVMLALPLILFLTILKLLFKALKGE